MLLEIFPNLSLLLAGSRYGRCHRAAHPMANTPVNLNFNAFLEKNKLKDDGSNYVDWVRNLKLILEAAKKAYVLNAPLGDPPAPATAQDIQNVWQTRSDDYSLVRCGMLYSLEMGLQRRFEQHGAYEMFEELKLVFKPMPMSRDMKSPTSSLASLPPSYKGFVLNYNMQGMEKIIPELYSMLKSAEVEIKKEHQVLMVNKTTSFKKGKGKKNLKKDGKAVAALGKPNTGKKKRNGPKPETECFYCKGKGHWKRNCPKYLADKKADNIKGDKFWSKRPKKSAMKQARPPPKKKSKGKGKAATSSHLADESQVMTYFREFSSHIWRLSDVGTSTNDPCPRESLIQTESALGDLKKSLTDQQDAWAKSEEKYQLILSKMEKLKADLKMAQTDQDALIKRAEKAEAKLDTVQQEVSGLKRRISNMAQAIFGPRAANLQDDCVLMLKAIYTLTEQLYTGSVLAMKAVMGAKEPIISIKKMLGCLSTLPPQIGELTRSAARKGALTMLSRCLAYAPEIKPEEVATGFPQLKDDGSEFAEEDYQRVVKESRLAATQLAASLDLSKYQAAYDNKNKKVNPPTFVTTSLIPRRPKNPFDLEADLSSVLNDEDEFAALSKCNWVLGNLQIEVGQSLQQADPRTSAE
ncbi:hypothetical protein ZWY2020_030305 [Hordeum vulgare]|nr:hypothetical protein ZWY2020_030305 [Hordeum vulgare]